jgi:kynurenine formamidase
MSSASARMTGRPRNHLADIESLEQAPLQTVVVALVVVDVFDVDHVETNHLFLVVAVPDKRCDIPTDLLMCSTTPKLRVQEAWT